MSRRAVAPSFTPPARLLEQVLRSVHHVGGDASEILRHAGLTERDLKGHAVISRDRFVAIYRDCLCALECRDAKRAGRRAMGPDEFRMLYYCMIGSATLGQAIDRAVAFYRLFDGTVGEFSRRTVGAHVEFRMRTAYVPCDVHMIFNVLNGLSSFARLFGWLIGKDLTPLTVKVCHGPVLDEDLVSWQLPWPVEYVAEDNILRFPARYLTLPIVRSPAELDELLGAFPFDLAAGRSGVMPASTWVRKILATALAHRSGLPDTTRIARQLGISVATLKRRLGDEGTSVRQLKARCRQELALDLLDDRTLPLGEIALRLGFSDTLTFSRAFKSWTGCAPSVIRGARGSIRRGRCEMH